MKKRVLSLIMIAVILISVLPMSVSAADNDRKIYYFKEVEKEVNGINLTIVYSRNEKNFLDKFTTFSLINRNEKFDLLGFQMISFPESYMTIKEMGSAMYGFIGNQFQSFLNEREENILNSISYRWLDQEMEPEGWDYRISSATELNLIRMPEGLENYNASNKVQNTLKDFVTLLGYRTIAEKRGSFPNGYISVAEEIGLTDGVEYSSDTDTTAIQFLTIANNALAVPLCLSQYEISSGQRDANRLIYTSDEDGEICNGYGQSGRYETLLTMHFNAFIAEGYLTNENGSYKYKINNVTNSKGNQIDNNIGNEISVNIGDVNFEAINNKPTKALIQRNEYGNPTLRGIMLTANQPATPNEYTVYDFDMRNITSPQTPNEGKANINKEQWTGDVFEFEAVTSMDVTEISICGDKPDDTKWHEIPYSYLKENYSLTYEDSGDRRYWTCRFGINETGYRKFMLKVNGYETDFFTYATLYENTNNASYDKEPPYEVKIMWQNVLDRNAVTLNGDDCDDDIVIQGFAYDNVGIKKVTLYYEGIEITSSYGNSVEATVQKSALHSGNNEFFVIAEDTAGNTAYSLSKYIVIDNAKPIDVTVNGNYVNFDVPPQVINGRTMIPIRAVTEALGGDVWWDESTNTAVITSYNKVKMVERTCYIQIGSDSMRWEDAGAVLNGGNAGTEWLDSPAVTIDGRTLVPIRAIAEVLGYTVDWNESTQTVSIYN
ncbi:MAG: copper amine oxidase N-terminal domain-containing protein [Clostridia bacterium]|nr:copper amine oxidase N-terminal domain-containing protein [Clostridia bacterium]